MFAIYFIIWHSIPSILDQMKFIYGSFTLSNFIAHYRNAFAYWLASLFGIGLSISYLEMRRYLMLFFSFSAAITFPHVLVILKMMHKKNTAIKPSYF
jgi:hypothetical protein